MSKRPPPKGDHQPDLFAANFADIPIRDQRDTMERPFFSLAKKPRFAPIEYHVGRVAHEASRTPVDSSNETALPACCGWIPPQIPAKESRVWRRNACRSRCVVWITTLAATLDARQQARFVRLCTGLLFARGRRTVTSWLRGCGVGRDYKRYYYLLGSVGRKTPAIARALFRILRKRLPAEGPDTPLVFAIDDSPTKRYGPEVEGAGKHHNPTPGPAGSQFLYGHVWVCLARLVRHPLWGTIGLPIVSHWYIRAKDVGWMAAYYGWQFQHEVGAGRRPGRVAGPAVGSRSSADLGGDRRGLRQAAVPEAGAGRGRRR